LPVTFQIRCSLKSPQRIQGVRPICVYVAQLFEIVEGLRSPDGIEAGVAIGGCPALLRIVHRNQVLGRNYRARAENDGAVRIDRLEHNASLRSPNERALVRFEAHALRSLSR